MIYSRLLATGGPTAGTDTLVYTAPALNTVVLRDIELFVSAGGATFISVYGQVSGPGDRAFVYAVAAPTTRQTAQWQGRQVLRPGEAVYVHADSGVLYYRLSGYVLT